MGDLLVIIMNRDCDLQVDVVFGEPHFQSHVLPWDNMHLWYAVTSLRPLLSDEVCVLPATMTIHAMAMHFKDLWKIRAPVGLCEGFLLNTFDNMIKVRLPFWLFPCEEFLFNTLDNRIKLTLDNTIKVILDNTVKITLDMGIRVTFDNMIRVTFDNMIKVTLYNTVKVWFLFCFLLCTLL